MGCYPHVPCSPDCLGDFTEMARRWAHKLKDGKEILMGLCEGHGTNVYLIKDGKLYIEHPTAIFKEWIPYTEGMDKENKPIRKRAFRMKIGFNLLTGQPEDIESKLIRRLRAYTRRDRAKSFRIGITSHPFRRFAETYAGKYDVMIILYKTNSRKDFSKLEAMLVRHNREVPDNKIDDNGGNTGRP